MMSALNSTLLNITTNSNLSITDMNNSTLWDNRTSNIQDGSNNNLSPSLIRDEDGNVICEQPSEAEYMLYVTFAWWLEGFGQILVGSLGKKFLF